MERFFLAGPADVEMFKGDTLFANANTMLDNSISISSSAEDVRGGIGAKLLGKYYHTSAMDITLTDVLFKLEYIALQTGSVVKQMADIMTTESVTLEMGGKGTLTGVPVAFGEYGLVGWATKTGKEDYKKVEFTNSGRGAVYTFTMPSGQVGDKVCVKYLTKKTAARSITVSSTFIPSEVHLIMHANLYRASADASASTASGSSLVGRVQIDVPRFQFSGAQEISMSATGVANSSLNGSALDNPANDCSGSGYYAIISEDIIGANWYDDVFALAVDDADITIKNGDKHTVVVYALTNSGAPFVPPVEDLSFKINGAGASVDAGVITANAGTGNPTLAVTITEKPDIGASAYITLTGE